jgi:hypothetical protein
MIQDALFITGAQRSGTTLLEKLIDDLPEVSILSQPFPLLFVAVKRQFLQSLGVEDVAYPLGHLFRAERSRGSLLAEFLARWRTSPAELRPLFDEMSEYSGQYTRFEREQLEHAFAVVEDDSDFAAVVRQLNCALRTKKTASFFGSKETTCEEFVPPLIERGFRCMLIVRDPRDVLASLNHGRGATFAGSPKPTLFNLRSWRKSVAHAFALDGHPRFQWCRYEDLVRDAEGVVRRIATGLGLPEPVRTELRGWRGNSSHSELQGISESPIGNYKNVLPSDVQQFVEAACLPELKALGYETSLRIEEATEILRGLEEPYTITREGMQGDRADANNRQLEIERLTRVFLPFTSDGTSWFLFDRAHARLREAMRA